MKPKSHRRPDLLFVLVIIASLGVILSTRADERDTGAHLLTAPSSTVKTTTATRTLR